MGGTTVPDTTASVKAAAADHLHAKALTYAALGPYGLGYPGLVHPLGKREAEPFYGVLPYAGVPSTGLPVQPLVASATPFGLTITPRKTPAVEAAEIAHFEAKAKALGKREADAEADAYYGYGGYGGYGYGGLYGYGLGYGYGGYLG